LMMLKPGDCLRVKTKTRDDVFGVCVYKVLEVGILPPEKERREAGAMDGVKCVMLGGTGPAARPGMTIMDSTKAISRDVKAGTTEIIKEAEAERVAVQYAKSKDKEAPSTGVTEVDW